MDLRVIQKLVLLSSLGGFLFAGQEGVSLILKLLSGIARPHGRAIFQRPSDPTRRPRPLPDRRYAEARSFCGFGFSVAAGHGQMAVRPVSRCSQQGRFSAVGIGSPVANAERFVERDQADFEQSWMRRKSTDFLFVVDWITEESFKCGLTAISGPFLITSVMAHMRLRDHPLASHDASRRIWPLIWIRLDNLTVRALESDETGVWIGISGGVQHRYSWTKPQFEHDAESVRQKLGKPERGTGKGSISSFPERHPTPDYDYRGGHAGH